MRTDRQTSTRGDLARTIENRPEESPGEVGLLPNVQKGRDLWSIGIIGPRLFLGVRHGSGVRWGRRILVEGGIEGGEKTSELYGKEEHPNLKPSNPFPFKVELNYLRVQD